MLKIVYRYVEFLLGGKGSIEKFAELMLNVDGGDNN
jgi:hypothetical protein